MQAPKALHVQKTISLLLVVLGSLLMAGKIHADHEPGAISLLLVVSGILWHVVVRLRMRTRRR